MLSSYWLECIKYNNKIKPNDRNKQLYYIYTSTTLQKLSIMI